LYYAIRDNEDLLWDALKRDLNKSPEETQMMETNVILGDLLYVIENLEDWMKDRKPDAIPLMFKFSKTKIEYIPLGTILVIGTFNYPLNLSLQPLIGAIAAGNTVVLKPSEQAPHVATALTELLMDNLDNELVQCINGGIDETSALLAEKFDKVFYTGSGAVGKIVATKCAEQLTPCILELGGKSPAFVTRCCNNLSLAAKRIVGAKFVNAGQTCVAVDYCYVDEAIYDEFCEHLIKWAGKLYGNSTAQNYSKIVNQKNVDRILSILGSSRGDVIYSGEHQPEERFIYPTILSNITWNDSTMKDELFAPVLPIMKYSSLSTAIEEVIKHHDTPLALYVFSNRKDEVQAIQRHIRSGAFVENDALIHVGMAQLPFGGVGNSGYGNYHGYNSFKAFSHERSILRQPWWSEFLLEARYNPISATDVKLGQFAMLPWSYFGRTGKVRNFKKLLFRLLIGVFAFYGLYLGLTSERDQIFPF
jgi:aldehyde dehydrogenase (NAD+)